MHSGWKGCGLRITTVYDSLCFLCRFPHPSVRFLEYFLGSFPSVMGASFFSFFLFLFFLFFAFSLGVACMRCSFQLGGDLNDTIRRRRTTGADAADEDQMRSNE